MNTHRLRAGIAVLAVMLCGCGAAAQKTAPREPWTEGFWIWNPDYSAASEVQADVLYVQAWGGAGKAPNAKEYWATFRYEQQGLPPEAFLAQVTAALPRFGRPIRGVQLDIDCPTRSLRDYAAFLKRVRAALPAGTELSITALLDWFRDGTDIASVVEQVDEFVPQFYDVGDPYRGEGIATPVEAKWGSRFQRFGKRFRIGISTFGRGRLPWSQRLYRSIAPTDIANDSRYRLRTDRNSAGEVILSYDPPKGEERIEFIMPTPEGVRSSVEEAKKMGASGVIFFRWPLASESLVLQPEEALGRSAGKLEVEAIRGDCVAVYCWDVALLRANRFAAQPVEYRIHSSQDVDYTVGSLRVLNPRELVFKTLPFAAKYRIELGRVITSAPATFTVEAK